MNSLISAILAFLAALAVTIAPAPKDTQSQVVIQSTPTATAVPNCYGSDNPNCWDEFYRTYQNCPQQLVDASGNVHVNDGYDLEFPELCKIWESQNNFLVTLTPTPELLTPFPTQQPPQVTPRPTATGMQTPVLATPFSTQLPPPVTPRESVTPFGNLTSVPTNTPAP